MKWCQETKVKWHYIAPGQAGAKRLLEKLQWQLPSFRDECLNETQFSSLTQARAAITAWKEDYNRTRPHSSLGNITPSESAIRMAMEETGRMRPD
nr:IS3 family transposase [Rhizobium sp. Q54]